MQEAGLYRSGRSTFLSVPNRKSDTIIGSVAWKFSSVNANEMFPLNLLEVPRVGQTVS
jgi:hypothetical protein